MKNCNIQQCFSKDYYDNNRLTLTTDVIDKCNYSCKYCCNRTSLYRTNKQLDLSLLADFIKYLKKKFSRKNIEVILIGGETMLHPDIYSFCCSMNEIEVDCSIFSNFSLPYSMYDALPENTSFIISWHKVRNDIFFTNFMEIPLSKLSKYVFNVMYEHDNILESIDVFNKIKQRTKRVSLRKVFSVPWYARIYTLQQLNMFDNVVNSNAQNGVTSDYDYCLVFKDGSTVIKNVIPYTINNPFKHWSCGAGEDLLHIDIDGNIYPCNTLVDDKNNIHGNIKYPMLVKLHPTTFCNAPACCNFCIRKTNVLNKQIDLNIFESN